MTYDRHVICTNFVTNKFDNAVTQFKDRASTEAWNRLTEYMYLLQWVQQQTHESLEWVDSVSIGKVVAELSERMNSERTEQQER